MASKPKQIRLSLQQKSDILKKLDDEQISDESMDDAVEMVPYDMAIDGVNKLIKWCEATKSTKHTPNLLDLRADIVKHHMQATKVPKRITNYFTHKTIDQNT